jgi:uncharacterized protein YdbL (DUF1318 family)
MPQTDDAAIRTAIDEANARRKARYAELADISDIKPRRMPKRNRRSSVPHRAIR